MSGSLNVSRNQTFRVSGARPKVYLVPTVRREQSTALDVVLCALVVTVGLFGGAVAALPQPIAAHLPMVHIALAFFVPFSTLFALTNLSPKIVIKSLVHGFLLAVVLGTVGLIFV